MIDKSLQAAIDSDIHVVSEPRQWAMILSLARSSGFRVIGEDIFVTSTRVFFVIPSAIGIYWHVQRSGSFA